MMWRTSQKEFKEPSTFRPLLLHFPHCSLLTPTLQVHDWSFVVMVIQTYIIFCSSTIGFPGNWKWETPDKKSIFVYFSILILPSDCRDRLW